MFESLFWNRTIRKQTFRKHNFSSISTKGGIMPVNVVPAASFLLLQTLVFSPTSLRAGEGLSLSIAPAYQAYVYSEPSVMSIKGQMKGFTGALQYAFEEHRHSLRGGYFFGEAMEYTGGKCSVADPSQCQSLIADSNDKYYYGEYISQWLLTMDGNPLVWFNAGAGYRELHNDVNEASAYKRKQSYIYAVAGLSLEHKFLENAVFYTNFYGRYLIRGNNTSYTTGIGFDEDLRFTQKKGYGALLEVGVKYRMSYVDFGVELYADGWYVEDSNHITATIQGASVGKFVEPLNYTAAIGARVILGI